MTSVTSEAKITSKYLCIVPGGALPQLLKEVLNFKGLDIVPNYFALLTQCDLMRNTNKICDFRKLDICRKNGKKYLDPKVIVHQIWCSFPQTVKMI